MRGRTSCTPTPAAGSGRRRPSGAHCTQPCLWGCLHRHGHQDGSGVHTHPASPEHAQRVPPHARGHTEGDTGDHSSSQCTPNSTGVVPNPHPPTPRAPHICLRSPGELSARFATPAPALSSPHAASGTGPGAARRVLVPLIRAKDRPTPPAPRPCRLQRHPPAPTVRG